MKKPQFLLKGVVIIGLFAGLETVCAQSTRLSQEELIAKRDSANDRNSRLEPKEGLADSQDHPSQSSILTRSVIIGGGRNWTFVPKGSVFHAPENRAERVNLTKRTGKYLPFAEFLRVNRGWLTTYNVTLEQARGKSPINEDAKESMEKGGRVVISVCKGGPISVRPPKVETAEVSN